MTSSGLPLRTEMKWSSALQNVAREAEAARNKSSSLRRALGILQSLIEPTSTRQGASLSELATSTGMNKSTLLRLIEPLRDAQLVDHGPDGRYRVGVGAVSLGGAYLAGLDMREEARPILEQLARDTGETLHLLIYVEGEVRYVEKIDGPSSIRMASRIGDRMPAYCTASGKVFLAYLPEEHFEAAVAAGMPARTPNTITSSDLLREDLKKTRKRGFAIDDIENELDIRCLSVPVFDRTGQVAAAMSISGLAARIHGARITELANIVQRGAEQLSLRLGAPSTLLAQPTEETHNMEEVHK
jgi:DNA-binding IclR family transcriptional regulator